MLMCCSQTAFAAAGPSDTHKNVQKSADGITVTSSGFTEVFREGGTQEAKVYTDIYIGHVYDERSSSSASSAFSAVANNNTGIMGSGLDAKSVHGGYARFYISSNGATSKFEVKGNKLVFESGSKASCAFGGLAWMYTTINDNAEAMGIPYTEGVVSGNSVTVLEGASANVIVCGFAGAQYNNIYCTSYVLDNTVAVTGSTGKGVWVAGYSNSLKSYVNNNKVILNDVVTKNKNGITSISNSDSLALYGQNSIMGGFADEIPSMNYYINDLWYSSHNEAAHIASENTVTINNSTIECSVYGGFAIGTPKSLQIEKDTIATSGNTVTLTDIEFSGNDIYAGCAENVSAYQSSITSATANGNTIVLNGGSYYSEDGVSIYGGYAGIKARNDGTTDGVYSTEASNNRIELRNGSEGAPVFSNNTLIFGGCARSTGADKITTAGTSTGNSLNFYDVKNMKAGNVGEFQILNYEYSEMRAGDVIMELSGAGYELYDPDSYGSYDVYSEHSKVVTDAKQPTFLTKAAVTVRVLNLVGSDGGEFKEGDKVVLFRNPYGIVADGISLTLDAPRGATLVYEADSETSEDKTEIYLIGRGARVASGTKAIAEGSASAAALAGEAATAAIGVLSELTLIKGAVTPFVHVQGSSIRHETGSSINMSTVSLVAGLGYGIETGAGDLGIGAFFEYGKGAYTTSNSFDDRSDINGDGSSWYMGGGILAKMEFLQTGPGHFYLEGSAHMGTLHNEYDSNDLTDVYGNAAKFDMDSPYYSLHGGIGYVWNMAEGHDLDVYGKYIWTRVQGTDDTLTTGDQYEFDDLDSNRVRFGVRYTYNGSERFSPYVGAAFEHEFSGSCDSRVYGHSVAAPSFEGSSGIGELGLMMKPTEDLPLSINLGVQGYVGQKQGIAGNCLVRYEF